MADNNAGKKVWKFSYQMWNKEWLEGTFVAAQDEIDWISDQIINFGEKANNELDVVVHMDSEYFQVVNEDPAFAEQFKQSIGVTGVSPFAHLDEDQYKEWDLEFGETYVNGVLVRGKKLQPPTALYEDQSSRVITYGNLTSDIFNYEDYEPNEELTKFLDEFEIVNSPLDELLRSQQPEFGRGSIDCMFVIKRRSDGEHYGYPYSYSPKYGSDDTPNGNKHGIETPEAYVWLPVKPFTVTGYKLR